MTANKTGHLAISQTVSAVSPTPIAPPTASTTGPVSTSAKQIAASMITITKVIRICSGRSLKNERPSGVSQATLEAREKAPT